MSAKFKTEICLFAIYEVFLCFLKSYFIGLLCRYEKDQNNLEHLMFIFLLSIMAPYFLPIY